MKIKFDKKINPIENIKEEPVNKRYWDRFIYIGVLVILLFSFLQWLTFPWFFDSAQGILLQQQYDVKFADDIRIIKYKVEEGQKIEKGDTLFSFERIDNIDRFNNMNFTQDSINIVIENNRLNQSLISLDGQIEKRRLFLIDLHKRLDYWKSERLRKEKLVYLDVITSNELANVDRSIDDVSYEISTIKSEYNVLIKERSQLLKELSKDALLNFNSLSLKKSMPTSEYFISPVKGKIDRKIIPEQQISYKENKITSIINPNFFVRAYIDMDDLNEFKIDDIVTIILPYKSKNLGGKVSKVYSVSELKDEIIKDNSIVDNRFGIVVEIVPINQEEWSDITVSNIPVKVRKGKINL